MTNLSSFIQFIGALYLSIAIDSTLFKRFWNPNFFKMLRSNTKHYTNEKGVNISTELNNKLINTAKDISTQIDTHSRKQGCIMLIYSMALLIAIGFKDEFKDENINIASVGLMFFLFFGLISFFFSRWFLKEWGYMFLTAIIVMLLPFIVFIPRVSCFFRNTSVPIVGLKIIILVTLLLPIVWRVFYNWLYTSVYARFIHDEIKNEYTIYANTKKHLKNRQSDKVDYRYTSILSDFFNNEGKQDTENRCVEVYVDIITDKCKRIPNVIELLLHEKNNLQVEEFADSTEDGTVETVHPLSNKAIDYYKEMFYKYQQLDKPIRLQLFCKQHGMDFEKFREYRNNQLKERQ